MAPEDNDISAGSAIIYCAKRKQTEEIAEFLQLQEWHAEAFHAGKNSAEKKHIQENFISSRTRIITATNAFGMGIDKEDVRLVIHADIPGSLENYLQEAGRAGRDQQNAECILLFDENDIDTQFKLSASSQVNKRDIAQILRGLRRKRKDQFDNVVITTGELLQPLNLIINGVPGRTRTASYPLGGDCIIQLCNGDIENIITINEWLI